MTAALLPSPGTSPAHSTRADDERRFRSVFAAMPAGVTVLTTVTPQEPVGMTASAVCSLSLRPQLTLSCIDNGSATLEAILEYGSFAINVLASDAVAISAAFAYQCAPVQRFAGVPYRLERGVPVLSGALAWATCTVHATHPGGDHTIVIGAVTGLSRETGDPLVWHDGRYRVLR